MEMFESICHHAHPFLGLPTYNILWLFFRPHETSKPSPLPEVDLDGSLSKVPLPEIADETMSLPRSSTDIGLGESSEDLSGALKQVHNATASDDLSTVQDGKLSPSSDYVGPVASAGALSVGSSETSVYRHSDKPSREEALGASSDMASPSSSAGPSELEEIFMVR